MDEIIDLIKCKFEIYIKLLSKFCQQLRSYLNDAKLETKNENFYEICYKFVERNIDFLLNLKIGNLNMPLIDQQKQQQQDDLQLKLQSINDKYLKMIINQTIDSFVNILDINYPHSFDYMLKTILEFSSNKSTIKYSSSHLKVFICYNLQTITV